MKRSYNIGFPQLLSVLAIGFVAVNVSAAPRQDSPPASQLKDQTSTSNSPGEEKCSEDERRRGDKAYRELAESTGGMVYGGPTEFLGQAMGILVDRGAPNVYNLVWRLGFVDDARINTIPVAVDTTLNRVDFVLNWRKRDSISMDVHRPDGSRVTPDEPKVSVIDIPTLKRVRVESPEVGTWTIKVKGKGGYDASAMGVTKIAFVDFSFSRLLDYSGRSFEQELDNTLLLGEEVLFEASLYGESRDPAVELIHPDGRLFETLTLEKDREYGLFGQYAPKQLIDPFLVRVTGTDANGSPFERVLRRTFAVSTLIVRRDPIATIVEAKQQIHRVEIRNAGAPDRFKITARSIGELPVVLSTDTVDVPRGGIELVDLTVTIPDDPKNKADTLFVTATSTRDESIRASTIVDVVLHRP